MPSSSFAIKLRDSYEGFAESAGLLSLNDASIVIQYQTKDAIIGLLKSELKVVNIPLAHVEEILFKKSLLGNKIIIKVDDLKYSCDVPGSESNEIVLNVARANVDNAVDFVRAIKLDMSEREYQDALNQAAIG